MNGSFDRRLRDRRARVLIRSWDYRQRHHARGVWYRLRRVLAEASAAFTISRDEGSQLIAEGHLPVPVGSELQPPKLIVFVEAARMARMTSARPIPVRLGPALLGADCVALTPFETNV